MGVAIRALLSSKDKKTGWRDEAEITPCTRKTHQTTRKTLRRCRSASNEALLSVLQLERQIFKAWKQQGEICETVQSVSPWQLIWGFWPAGRQATPIVRNLWAEPSQGIISSDREDNRICPSSSRPVRAQGKWEGHENAVINEIMFIVKAGCGSSHGGAQAALPINIDIPRRLMQKNSAPSDTTKSTSLDIILGTKCTFLFWRRFDALACTNWFSRFSTKNDQ